MLTHEFILALYFYLIFSLFGAIGLPITARLFGSRNLAYVAAKFAGLIVFGYVVWLLCSVRLLDYQNYKFIISLFGVCVGAGIWLSRHWFRDYLKDNRKFANLLIVEAITLAVYLLYLWVRAHNSAINGTERFMDMAMLNASGKTHFFPFIDPWYAGKTVNYYYYGSYLISLISNIARIKYVLSYNFALALLYCQSATLPAMLVLAITKSKKMAIAAAFLVTTAGSLFFANCTIKAALAAPHQVCGYPSSTRLYTPSYIINEIPSYSFTVGDLHAHLLALPFFIFDLILLYEIFKSEQWPKAWQLGLLGLAFATSAMINAWDFVSASVVLVVLIYIKIFSSNSSNQSTTAAVKNRKLPHKNRELWNLKNDELSDLKMIAKWLLTGLGVMLFAGLLMLPNLLNFQSPILGLGFIPVYVHQHALKNIQWPTPLMASIGIWGIFIAGITMALVACRKYRRDHDYLFTLALSIVSISIIIGVEIFFIKDIYSIANPPYFRANTTFKFGYHAWVMLCIAFSISIAALYRFAGIVSKSATATLLILALGGGIFYPYQALRQFYFPQTVASAIAATPAGETATTLDGSIWMQNGTLADWETVNYINANIRERAVLAEAVGDSYSNYSRITTFTGMITPMGWMTHEWTWRFKLPAAKSSQGKNSIDAAITGGQTIETGYTAISKVAADIKELYTSNNSEECKKIIRQYGIKYVYIGNLEKTAYPDLSENKFYVLAHVVFQSYGSRLFLIDLSAK